ncbi:hypothetical protein [Hoylesella shahii]|nr:hypothetical protein [Hoylesella shahii]
MLLTANEDSIMQTQYKYDPVDNILGISNVITPKAPKKPKGFGGPVRTDGMDGPVASKGKKEKPLGGAFSHTYAYDELNRLVRAESKSKGIGYVMDMSFGLMGEPLTKVSAPTRVRLRTTTRCPTSTATPTIPPRPRR